MKKVFVFMSVLFLMGMSYGQTAKIDDELLHEMATAKSGDLFRVIILMEESYDYASMGRATLYMTKDVKREFVINEMKTFTSGDQAGVLELLDSGMKEGLVEEITPFWVFNGIGCLATADMVHSLAARSDIRMVYSDSEENMSPEEWDPTPAEPGRGGVTWNVAKVNADDVWAQYDITGEGVIVALIDSGVNYDHADIADNMWDGGTDFPHHGWDFVNNDNDPKDDHGHGSHCAGIIAGYGTSGTKTGVAPGVKIMAIKTLNSENSGFSSNTLLSIQFALTHGADILSMSLGRSGGGYAPYRDAMVTANNAGVVASVAAGNLGSSSNLSSNPIPKNIKCPGSCPPPWLHPDQANVLSGGLSAVVCVGSTDSTDIIAPSSSYGPATWASGDYIGSYNDYPYTSGSTTNKIGLIRPDVAAPGVSIVSLSHSSNTGYATKSGTSMATPCVAGVMALLLQANPSLTPALIDKAIETTAVQCGRNTSKNNRYGSGRVDALAAIQTIGYPITLYGNDTVMRVVYASQDYPVDIPDATPVNDYEFFGWSLSNVSPTQTEPNIVNAEGYAPSGSTELYAVYRIAIDETDCWYSTSITAVSGELEDGAMLPNGYVSGPVTIPEGVTVECEYGFGNTDPANLVIEEGGQLIVNNAGIQATVKKNLLEHGTYVRGENVVGWYFISSPVESQSISGFVSNAGESGYDLYRWVGSNMVDGTCKPWYNQKAHADFETSFLTGMGYLAGYQSSEDFAFEGALNHGNTYDFSSCLTYGAENLWACYALLGNPYSYALDWADFQKSDVYDGIAIVDPSTGAYAYYSGTATINPCQGFLVMTTGDNPQLQYQKGTRQRMQVGQVAVVVSGQQGIDNAIIRLGDEGKGGFAKMDNFNAESPMLWLPVGGVEYAIASFVEDVAMVPVSFKAGSDGAYTLSVDAKGLDADYLHLIDHVTGADVDLLSTPSYIFEARKTDYAARFRIVFSQEAPVSDGESFAYVNGGRLVIENEGAATVQITDMAGRVLRRENIQGGIDEALNLKPGMYIVSLLSQECVRSQKLVVE